MDSHDNRSLFCLQIVPYLKECIRWQSNRTDLWTKPVF